MSVKKIIAGGVFVTVLTKYAGLVVNLIISGILARVLSPEEFGIVGIAMVLITFFNLLGDLGISPAIVQHPSLNKGDYSSIFSFTLVLATALSMAFYFSSYFISIFYESLDLIVICKMLSLLVFFNVIKMVPNAILLKELQFKRIGIVTVISQIGSGILGIYFALAGYGFFSLVYKSILFSIFIFIVLFSINPIKPSSINLHSIRKISRFSTYQFLFNIINYFSRNLDNLLIGKYLGKSSLGFYEKSYTLMLLPVQNLTHVITPVLHPVFSSLNNENVDVSKNYFFICKILAILGIPISIFLYFSANELISIIYGDQWIESIDVFQILALSVGFQVILSSAGSIFQASNRTDLLFKSGLLSAFIMVSLICIGVFYFGDLVSIGWCLVLSFFLNFIQTFFFLVRTVLNRSLLEFYKILVNPFLAGLVLFFVYHSFANFLVFSNFVNLFFKMGILFIFVVLLVLTEPDLRIISSKLFRRYCLKSTEV